LAAVIVPLTVIASSGGLFLPGLYRDPVMFVPVLQGQDLVTLIAMPFLAGALLLARRGSVRAAIAWIGLLGYVWYTYTGAAVAYYFNSFFLIYVTIFSLSAFALVFALSSIDVDQLGRRFATDTPRKPVAIFLLLIALMLGPLEIAQIVPFIMAGAMPQIIVNSGGVTNFVYVLDLGVIVPLALISAIWLWRRVPWGYVLAGGILTKGTTMGLALLSMDWFSMRSGQPSDGLALMWAIIAFGSLGMLVWLLRHYRE
jgi:hypothetical protein